MLDKKLALLDWWKS